MRVNREIDRRVPRVERPDVERTTPWYWILEETATWPYLKVRETNQPAR
jgi:hypothetical protein